MKKLLVGIILTAFILLFSLLIYTNGVGLPYVSPLVALIIVLTSLVLLSKKIKANNKIIISISALTLTFILLYFIPASAGCRGGAATVYYISKDTVLPQQYSRYTDIQPWRPITIREMESRLHEDVKRTPIYNDAEYFWSAKHFSSQCYKPILRSEYDTYEIKINEKVTRVSKDKFETYIADYNSSCAGCLFALEYSHI